MFYGRLNSTQVFFQQYTSIIQLFFKNLGRENAKLQII